VLDFLRGPAGDEHVVSFGREAPAERGAKPALGTDTNDDRSRLGLDAEGAMSVSHWSPLDRLDGKRDALATADA
jgi:hypothetical protein